MIDYKILIYIQFLKKKKKKKLWNVKIAKRQGIVQYFLLVNISFPFE